MTETYRVRVSLLDSEPEIWRLVEMSSALSLPEVHDVLQIAMGWRDSHLHTFRSADGRQWWDATSLEDGLEGSDEESATLADVLTVDSGPLRYDYDLGDGWEHQVELIHHRASAGAGVDPRGAARAAGGQWRHGRLRRGGRGPA